jgi:hypothetical protein
MSRSNPNEGKTPNPSTRWFEWDGANGVVRYYDKETKKNVEVGSDFTFILLDELGCVRGWHDASGSSIYSNEVRDTRQEALVVKAFKGGTLAEGFYRDIRDKVNTLGGQYNANCYIAYKNDATGLEIGSLRFKGAALGAWMEFRKEHKTDVFKKSIRIKGYTEGKKGKVVFRVPGLFLKDISPETDKQALALDQELQQFLAVYFKQTKRQQVEVQAAHDDEPEPTDHPPVSAPVDEEDIPF